MKFSINNSYLVNIEISKGSSIKYEIDKLTGKLHLDRVLFGSNVYPQNYGYLPNTLDHDGDPLDVFVISQYSLLPNSTVDVRILGAFNMIDDGDRDTKLIAVIDKDIRYKHIVALDQLGSGIIQELSDFLLNYKNLENKKTEIKKILNSQETEQIILEGFKLFNKK